MRRWIAAMVVALAVTAPAAAQAFCGFYVAGGGAKLFNNATQVALMRDGTTTVMSMQNNYQGPAKDFAMVVPVPVVLSEENVKTLESKLFDRLDTLSSPRLVEYWEMDPCALPVKYRRRRGSAGSVAKPRRVITTDADYGVTIEAKFAVGEYDIVILSAKDSVGLYDWLKDNQYKIPTGGEKVLAPYIANDMKFFVAKVDIEKVAYDKKGNTKISPLRFHYESEKFTLPVRLGLLNSKGTQDLIVYVLGDNQRYQVSNYENVTIPTNIRVRNSTKKRFARFYTSLFDQTLKKNPGAVVTEYAWQSNKCDPCPGPAAALSPSEIRVLGGDVVNNTSRRWVLTRLHTRYSKKSLGEDLVFEQASPIMGGRESYDKNRKLELGAQSSTTNQFQGRYIIRHPWTGKVSCKSPVRGRWGGPPNSRRNRGNLPTVAANSAYVKKRRLRLTSYVLQSIPEIGVRYKRKKRKPKRKVDPKRVEGAEAEPVPAEAPPKN